MEVFAGISTCQLRVPLSRVGCLWPISVFNWRIISENAFVRLAEANPRVSMAVLHWRKIRQRGVGVMFNHMLADIDMRNP